MLINAKAIAYLLEHSKTFAIDGQAERMLSLERIRGFLDLLQPGDVPPEKLQRLYAMQARFVAEARMQLRAVGWLPEDAPPKQ